MIVTILYRLEKEPDVTDNGVAFVVDVVKGYLLYRCGNLGV